jgi:membrane protein involved in colicin uptake
MSEFERRIRDLWTRITAGLSGSAKTAGRKRSESAAQLRKEAAARAQQAAAKARDLRDTDTAKKAGAAINDLRASDAGKKAESAIADLRQREPVKKAEESARKVMHDLFSGGAGSGDKTGSTPAS